MNIGQRDLDPLFSWNIYTSNSCHLRAPFSLMTVVTGTRFTSTYVAAFIGHIPRKSAKYKPKLLTVNLYANALPQ
jgi:hypothetical protein